ncbi:MAG: carbonic anhydrase [Oscillospiraceae bacterium]|nr:carbonic anhydrase [Oscillospiraceae bacterium]
MRKLSILIAVILLLSAVACKGSGVNPAGIHSPDEQVSDWQAALAYLSDGNARYLEGRTVKRNDKKDREVLSGGQHPFAAIVTCADSRVAPEIYFDQKLGDIFVIRNAGNIADPAVLGSLEYAAEHLHVPLIVVVGHSFCGAVSGALSEGEFPENLQAVIDEIAHAVQGCTELDEAVRANADYVARSIKENPTVSHMGTEVIAAHYDIETGVVAFM